MQGWFTIKKASESKSDSASGSSRDSASLDYTASRQTTEYSESRRTRRSSDYSESRQTRDYSESRQSNAYTNSQANTSSYARHNSKGSISNTETRTSYNDSQQSRQGRKPPVRKNTINTTSEKESTSEESYVRVESCVSSDDPSGPPSTLMIRSTNGSTMVSGRTGDPDGIPYAGSSISMMESLGEDIAVIHSPAKLAANEAAAVNFSFLDAPSHDASNPSLIKDVSTITESVHPVPAHVKNLWWVPKQDSPASEPMAQSTPHIPKKWKSRAQSASPTLPANGTSRSRDKVDRDSRVQPEDTFEESPAIETQADFSSQYTGNNVGGNRGASEYQSDPSFSANNPSMCFSGYTSEYDLLSPDVRIMVNSETPLSNGQISHLVSYPSPPIVPSLSPLPEGHQLSHVSSIPTNKSHSVISNSVGAVGSNQTSDSEYMTIEGRDGALINIKKHRQDSINIELTADSGTMDDSLTQDSVLEQEDTFPRINSLSNPVKNKSTMKSRILERLKSMEKDATAKPPRPPQKERLPHPQEISHKKQKRWSLKRNKNQGRRGRSQSFSTFGSASSAESSYNCSTAASESQIGSFVSRNATGIDSATSASTRNRSFSETYHDSVPIQSFGSGQPTVELPPSTRSRDFQRLKSLSYNSRPVEIRLPIPASPLSMDSGLLGKSPSIGKLASGRQLRVPDYHQNETFSDYLSRPALSPHSDKNAMKRAESDESGYYERFEFDELREMKKECKSPKSLAPVRSLIKSVGSHFSRMSANPFTSDKAALSRMCSLSDEEYSFGSNERKRAIMPANSNQIPSKVPSSSGCGGCLNRLAACICSSSFCYTILFAVMALALGYGVVDRSDFLLSLFDGHKEVTVAFVGNAYFYANDVPRLTERISGYRIHQSSVIHSGGSLAALSATGNGMYPKWMTDEAIITDTDVDMFEDDENLFDYGMCSVTQLLKGYDENLMYMNENGYYYNDGHNPCIVVDGYLDFLQYKMANRTFEWDYVVLVDQTKRMAVAEARQDTIDSLVEFYAPLLKESGARPIIVDTHSFWSSNTNMTGLVDVPTFQKLIYEGVDSYVNALARSLPRKQQPLVAPIGIAYLTVWEEDYDLWERLFIEDEVHSSLLGTYLFSCVLYMTIYGHMPPEEYSLPASFKYFFSQSRKLIGEEPEVPTYEEAEYLRLVAKRVTVNRYVPSSFKHASV